MKGQLKTLWDDYSRNCIPAANKTNRCYAEYAYYTGLHAMLCTVQSITKTAMAGVDFNDEEDIDLNIQAGRAAIRELGEELFEWAVTHLDRG